MILYFFFWNLIIGQVNTHHSDLTRKVRKLLSFSLLSNLFMSDSPLNPLSIRVLRPIGGSIISLPTPEIWCCKESTNGLYPFILAQPVCILYSSMSQDCLSYPNQIVNISLHQWKSLSVIKLCMCCLFTDNDIICWRYLLRLSGSYPPRHPGSRFGYSFLQFSV